MLPSDELGEKGESRFKEICADALLICNKSDRDRTGWDFIVEFPFDPMTARTLDRRTIPISCHVQVKTVSAKTKSIKMRLSAAERLAKEVKPAFVYVFTVGDDLEFKESFLIHILDNRLSTILKRLRAELADGHQEEINKKSISFRGESSEILTPTGAELRKVLESKCALGMNQYAVTKNSQLENLGFGPARYEGSMTFPPLPEEELLDVLLGIKKEVAITNIEVNQTRFGITLVDILPTPATISMHPQPISGCTVTFREQGLAVPVILQAELFVAAVPGSKKERMRSLLRMPLISLTIDMFQSKTKKHVCTVSYDLSQQTLATLAAWENFWTVLRILSSGTGNVEIAVNEKVILEFPFAPTNILSTVEYCNSWISYCQDISELLKYAGTNDGSEFTYEHLVSSQKDVFDLRNHWKLPQYRLTIETVITGGDVISQFGARAILSKAISIGNATIAYYGVGTFATKQIDNAVTWDSIDFVLKRIKSISTSEQYNQFVEAAQVAEKTTTVFRTDLEQPS